MRQDWEEALETALFAPPLSVGSGARCKRDTDVGAIEPPAFILATDKDTGLALVVDAGENLLKAIERQNPKSSIVGCRNGGCGVCRVQLLSGKVQLGKMSRRFVSVDMERERFALACRVYPQGDVSYRLAPIEPRTV